MHSISVKYHPFQSNILNFSEISSIIFSQVSSISVKFQNQKSCHQANLGPRHLGVRVRVGIDPEPEMPPEWANTKMPDLTLKNFVDDVRVHHMFSRILNFLFIVVFSIKKSHIVIFYILFWSLNENLFRIDQNKRHISWGKNQVSYIEDSWKHVMNSL